MKKLLFLGLFFISFVAVSQTTLSPTDATLKAIADRYDKNFMYFDYELHSYDQYMEKNETMSADYQALQLLDPAVQQTSLWQNLNYFLKAQSSQEQACKPYYWVNDSLYNIMNGFTMQQWLLSSESPKTMDEFNKLFDEGLAQVQTHLKFALEKLIRIQVDGVMPPQAAFNPYYMMLDRPEIGLLNRLGLTDLVAQLPNMPTCLICAQIDGQKLIDKYDLDIAPIMAEIVVEVDKLGLLANSDTPLDMPPSLRVDCYKSVLTGIYSDLTGPMVLKKGENELLRAEKSMLEILMKLGKPLTPPLSITAFIEHVYDGMAADPKYHLNSESDYQKIYDVIYQRFQAKKNLITSAPLNYPLNYEYDLQEGFGKGGGYSFDDVEEAGYFYTASGLDPGYLSFEIAWLFIHEGVPGHHLEQSMDRDFRKSADTSFDQLKNFSPYVEGWGLYTEELAFDLDLYQSLEEQFAFYDALRLRALRMINAYRFYFDGWDEAKVVAFTDEHLFGGTADAIDAVARAKRWNAQGVGYMTGKTMLLSMKNSAHKILGSGCFTLAEYHDSFLTKGSTHLDTLVWQTAQWIKNNQCYRGKLTRDEIEAELRKDIINAFAH
jgi:hypothetical protein